MHTKGKWELEHSITSLGYARVKLILNKHGTIGFVNMWRDQEEEAQANARLIAAAPELLQRLEEARDAIVTLEKDALGWVTGDSAISVQGWPLKEELLHRIDQTIRGAKGE